MIKEISIQDVAVLNRDFEYVDDDFIMMPLGGDQTSVLKTSKLPEVRFTDIIIVFLSQGELDGIINQTPLKMRAGDMLISSNAMFAPSAFSRTEIRGHALFVSRRLMIDSIPLNHLMQTAMLSFDRDYTLVHLQEPQKKYLERLGELFHVTMNEPSRLNGREIIRLLTKSLLCNIVDILYEATPAPVKTLGQSEKIVIRFFGLLADKQPRPRFIDFYASELCVSAKHLSEVCKKVTGRTALQWITEYIVRDVRYYLLYTDLSIKEIVFALGFPNASFFGKYVRTHLGASPNAFRKSVGKTEVRED